MTDFGKAAPRVLDLFKAPLEIRIVIGVQLSHLNVEHKAGQSVVEGVSHAACQDFQALESLRLQLESAAGLGFFMLCPNHDVARLA